VKRGDATSTKLVPMDQFKDFVRRVVSVPKKEIARALSKHKRRQEQPEPRRK